MAKGLSGDVSALISAEPDPSTPPKLLRAGLAARGELVKQMESMNEKLMPLLFNIPLITKQQCCRRLLLRLIIRCLYEYKV